MSTLSIIIPVFNEQNTIIQILDKLTEVSLSGNLSKEIVIIDDCSFDSTATLITEYIENNNENTVKYFRQDINRGKGAAIHQGIKLSTGDFVIVQDADLEYDVVYGSRFIGGNPRRVLFFWHTIGNKFLTLLSNIVTNLNLTDMETCYKMFKGNIIRDLQLVENRFGFDCLDLI